MHRTNFDIFMKLSDGILKGSTLVFAILHTGGYQPERMRDMQAPCDLVG